MHSYKNGGLIDKYRIEKKDGTPIDENAKYFVLRYDVDPHAKKALKAYADSVMKENPELANDILGELG